jgi:hypothetical protein
MSTEIFGSSPLVESTYGGGPLYTSESNNPISKTLVEGSLVLSVLALVFLVYTDVNSKHTIPLAAFVLGAALATLSLDLVERGVLTGVLAYTPHALLVAGAVVGAGVGGYLSTK